MATAKKRTYGDPCGVARALDAVGERWALLVVRELLLGPKRFTDLRAGLPGLSPDVLSQRLRELEQAGILARRTMPPPAASHVYELTDRGHELHPVVLALGRWGSRAAFPHGDAELGVDAFVIALMTLFDPAAAGDDAATYELRLGEQTFSARVADGRFDVARGEAIDPDAVVTAQPAALAAVLWHGRSLTKALRAKELAVEGDARAVKRLSRLFPAPAPPS
jgi:DNA-binding HxlR family transcriptional regulator